MIFFVIILFGLVIPAKALDSCYSFSTDEQYAITSSCGAAVDYPFYLKSGTTLFSLENAARILLTDQKFVFSSLACIVNYKKLVCSNIYTKCQPGLIMNDTSTYNKNIYSNHPVPFTRPCEQVCSNVVQSCAGLFQQNCSATIDYSGGLVVHLANQYDKSNDPVMCNIVPALFAVAGTSEPYLYQKGGACAGLLTDVFIPPGNLLSPYFTYLTPQYVIQSVIESKLVESFAQIPVTTSSDCHFAFRKYFCGSFMLQPQSQKVSTALLTMGIDPSTLQIDSSLLDTTFHLPQYPDSSVCTDYATKCQVFLGLANITALFPKCDGKIPGTDIKTFPSVPQVVNYVVLPLVYKNVSKPVTYSPIYLFSTPNTFSSANDANYVTRCPTGFVVPEHPNDPRSRMIPGTGCAFACRFPIWTVDEYKTFDFLVTVLSAIGLPMVVYFVVTSLMNVDSRKTQYLRIIYASTVCGLAPYILGMSRNPARYFCKDNAIPYNMIYDGATACTVQAVAFFYGALINGVAWTMISIDLYLKIIAGIKNTTHHFTYHIVTIYILPAIYTAAVAATGVEFGYTDTSSAICSISSNDYKDVYFLYIPLFVLNVIGLITGGPVIYTIIHTISNASSIGSRDLKRFLMLRTPLFFLLMFLTLWCAAFVFRAIIFVKKEVIMDFVISWTTCVFKNYTGLDSSWQGVCGLAPQGRPSFAFNVFILSFIAGQGILITMIFKGGKMYTITVARVLGRPTPAATLQSPSTSNALLGAIAVRETTEAGPNTAFVNSHWLTFKGTALMQSGKSLRMCWSKDKNHKVDKKSSRVLPLDRSSVRVAQNGLSSVRIKPDNTQEKSVRITQTNEYNDVERGAESKSDVDVETKAKGEVEIEAGEVDDTKAPLKEKRKHSLYVNELP